MCKKRCSKCEEEKDESCFYHKNDQKTKEGRAGKQLDVWCKDCRKPYDKEQGARYYAENKAKVKEKNKRNRTLKLYRITLEEEKQIEDFERGDPQFRLLLTKAMGNIDHDHRTGMIRGKLDWRINRAYGLLEKVDPENVANILRALASYHDSPPATEVLGERRYGLIGKAQYKKKMIYGSPTGPIKASKKEKK